VRSEPGNDEPILNADDCASVCSLLNKPLTHGEGPPGTDDANRGVELVYRGESLCTQLSVSNEKNPIFRAITQHVQTIMRSYDADVVRHRVFGVPDDGRAVVNIDGLVEHGHEVLTVTGGRQH